MKSFHLRKEATPNAVNERLAVVLLWALLGALVGLVSFIPLAAIILGSRNAVFGTVDGRTHLQFLPLSAVAFASIPLAAIIRSGAERDYSRLLWQSMLLAGMSLPLTVVFAYLLLAAARFVVDKVPWWNWREGVVDYFLLGVPVIVALVVLGSGYAKRNQTVQPVVPPNAD
jgi:Mn2+/Fe2+ NRAMP family transporter